MLRWLAILTMFLGLAQMAHNQQESPQKHPEAAKTNVPASIAINNYDHSTHDQQKIKDVARWWPEGVTAVAILLTLLAISVQTFYTRKAVEAANKGMEIAKTKERAKLRIVLELINLQVGAIPSCRLTITNVGESRAFFGLAAAGMYFSDSEDLNNNGDGWYQLKISGNVLNKDEVSEEITGWPGHVFNTYTAEMIEANGTTVIHAHGVIAFRDAFEDEWSRKFHYIWRKFPNPIWMVHLQRDVTGQWESRLAEREEKTPQSSEWQKRFRRIRAAWKKLEDFSNEYPK